MIFLLSGWKGSGKDECAKLLTQKNRAVRIALADPLKDSVAQEFGIDRSSLDDPKQKELPILSMPVDPKDGFSETIASFLWKEFRTEKGEAYKHSNLMNPFGRLNGQLIQPTKQLFWTPRALAILKGSTNRSVMSNFWTQKTFEKIEHELNSKAPRIVVVTDVRYKSELQQFKEKFGDKIVTIRINRFKESPSNDPSERDLDDAKFDFYVNNTGTLDFLHHQIWNIEYELRIRSYQTQNP